MSRILRSLLLSIPLGLLAGSAQAESLVPRDEAPVATVRILPTELTPERSQLDEGRTLRIANRSTGLARLEFHVKRGTGLSCKRPGEAAVSARKFVLSDGEVLHCLPPRGRVDYRVQRVVRRDGGTSNQVDEGRIEVR